MRNNDLPLVSVLIPLYNHERYIVQAIESVVCDEYPNKELIVLDDGSSDASFAIVKAWHAENVHRAPGRTEIISRPNQGVAKTLNELLAMAKGDLIAFLSSDDYLLPGGIQARVDYLQRHPAKMMVVADYRVVDKNGNLTYENGTSDLHRANRSCLSDDRLIRYELIFHWCLAGPVYMGRKELYKNLGGYDETALVEDWPFCLKMLAADILGFVDQPVAAYRIHGENSIRNKDKKLMLLESFLKSTLENIPAFKGLIKYRLIASSLKLKARVLRYKKRKGALFIFDTLLRIIYKFASKRLIFLTGLLYEMKLKRMEKL